MHFITVRREQRGSPSTGGKKVEEGPHQIIIHQYHLRGTRGKKMKEEECGRDNKLIMDIKFIVFTV